MLLRFDSVPSYISQITTPLSERSEGIHWDLGVSAKRASTLALTGDTSMVQSLSHAIDHVSPPVADDMARAWVNTVAGTRVSVPAYLSGNPMAMRKRTVRETSTRHVNVYVELASIGSIEASDLLRRGATVLAFLEYLQTIQVNVDLYLMVDTYGSDDGDLFQVIHVDSRPLDLSVAGFALAHPAFCRNVAYANAKRYGFNGDTSRSYKRLSPEDYQAHVRKVVGMAPSDVYVPEARPRDPLLKDPARWLSERITGLSC